MPYTFTTEEVRKKFYSLPEVVKDVILDLDQPDILYAIAKNNGLRIDQMDDFFRIVKHCSIGLIPYNKVGDELVGVIKVSVESAQKISKEIDDAVFSKIRNAFSNQDFSNSQNKTISATASTSSLSQNRTISPSPKTIIENPRPPMTPFINTGQFSSRFEPWRKDATAKKDVPQTGAIGVPNYSGEQKTGETKPILKNINPETQNTNPEKTMPPKTPLFVPIPQKNTPINEIPKTFIPTNNPIPKPSIQTNNIQTKIGQEISSQKINPTQINATNAITNKVPNPPYINTGFQRGKFGQGFMPTTNFGNKIPQNVSAIPRTGAIPSPAPIQTNTPILNTQNTNPKIGGTFKSSQGETIYKVDPYREETK